MKTLPGSISRRVASTAAPVWVAAHVLPALAIALSGSNGGSALALLGGSWESAALVTGLVVAITWIDIHATGDATLYANLGVRPLWISTIAGSVAVVLEALLALVLALADAGAAL